MARLVTSRILARIVFGCGVLSALGTARAGTFSLTTQGTIHPVWDLGVFSTNYKGYADEAYACLSVTSTSEAISGTSRFNYYVRWTPAYQGELGPSTARVTATPSVCLHGPAGSSAAVKTRSGTTLVNTLGTSSQWTPLAARTYDVAMSDEDGDGILEGRLSIPVDQLQTSGGATVEQKFTINGIVEVTSPPRVVASRLGKRSAVRQPGKRGKALGNTAPKGRPSVKPSPKKG